MSQQSLEIFVSDRPLVVSEIREEANKLYAKIEKEIADFVPDLSTGVGRKEVASLAYKISRTKTAVDAAGEKLIEDAQRTVKTVNAERKQIRDKLDELRDKARKPLTDWEYLENEKEKAVQSIAGVLSRAQQSAAYATKSTEVEDLVSEIDGLNVPEILGEESKQELETNIKNAKAFVAAALERLKRSEAEKAELARLRAEKEKAEKEREEMEARIKKAEEEKARAEKEKQEALERAEREKKEAEEREAERVRLEAEKEEREKSEAEAREKARIEAEKAEKVQLEREQREAEERERKLKDEKEERFEEARLRIEELLKALDIDDVSDEIMVAIEEGKIPHVSFT